MRKNANAKRNFFNEKNSAAQAKQSARAKQHCGFGEVQSDLEFGKQFADCKQKKHK